MTHAQIDITVVVTFFGSLFVVLGLWQWAIERAKGKQVAEELKDARSRGTNRAIAQHPQIKPHLCIGCSSCIRACPEEGVLGLVNGIAEVIHGSRCIGHGRCAEVCPVNAITVGLGDLSERPDIPILSENLESSVPGLYVAGELGGIALIRNAVEQGARAMSDIVRKIKESPRVLPEGALDVLVVGVGPSGISAALSAIEAGLRHRVIAQDDIGGTVRHYPRRKMTLTQPVAMPLAGRMRRQQYLKEELISMWEEASDRFDVDLQFPVKLLGVEKDGEFFLSKTSAGEIRSRFVVLALGRRGTPRKLGVAGEDQEKVLYRLIDAATYENEHVLVVGGGDSAIEAATALAEQPGNIVTLSYRKHGFFRLKARNEDRIREYEASGRIQVVYSSGVSSIEPETVTLTLKGDDKTEGEYETDGERRLTIPNNYVFVFAGGEPPFPLLKSMGIQFGGSEEPVPALVAAAQ
jgi:thioredoxin reductase (NADPH)